MIDTSFINALKSYPLSYKIEKLRLRSGMTQRDFAKEIGCSYTALSSWELGKRTPLKIYLEKIIMYFGLPMDFFMDETFEQMNLCGKRKGTKNEPI
jgi:transcriptional regulator with XRE-family HTH domain